MIYGPKNPEITFRRNFKTMAEPKTYCGASSHHVHCEDYKFQHKIPLRLFNTDKKYDNFRWLDIKRCSGVLDSHTFINVSGVQVLGIIDCEFVEIGVKSFEILQGLSSISVWKSKFPFTDASFDNCPSVKSLSFIKCPNTVMLKGLAGFNMLKSLFIDRSVVNVNGGAFDDLKELECLSLSNSNLENFDYKVLLKLQSLKKLTFFGNTIGNQTELIDYQIFDRLPNLEAIMFPAEAVKSLNFRAFGKLKLVQLDINDEAAERLLNFLTEKNIIFEWTSFDELPDIDEHDPNILVCA
ncbi:uncharacterized protein LOC132706307 isoform X2 [Cylas formicarius]|uniref:uncharacterized protein LOC132706307 isoform X2 n=1 Tax=Cylas formicarius TaxID=197179 RepID=UPI0029588805|nr:uncharacterized protein LOC132706307 isoform X2 [Cylas formicarius]